MALKQSCCWKKLVSKRKTRRTAEHTVKPEKSKPPVWVQTNVENHIENETVQGNALFFVVQGETEGGCPRSKLSGCPKMVVGMLLESCGRTETAWLKKVVVTCCTSHLRWNHGRRLRSCSCAINGYLHATGRCLGRSSVVIAARGALARPTRSWVGGV